MAGPALSSEAYVETQEERRARIAAENRRNFPRCMVVAESFRAVFGDGVRMLYAEEDGKKIGKPAADNGRWVTAGEWLAQSARMKRLGLLAEDDGGIKQVRRGRK
jgi:hypothetical protein